RVHGLSILLVGLRPGAHMREAQGLEGAIDRIVRHRESELLMQPHDQIARPPAHHAMDRRDRTLLYDSGEKGLVPGVELGRHPRRGDIDETVRPLFVEPDHPVPQRLTIHATDRGRLFPRRAVEHGRNRQQPSRLRSIFRSLGKTANLAGGVVRPHRNGPAHGKPPQFAILNHAAIDSGIPRESATQRLGISFFHRHWHAVHLAVIPTPLAFDPLVVRLSPFWAALAFINSDLERLYGITRAIKPFLKPTRASICRPVPNRAPHLATGGVDRREEFAGIYPDPVPVLVLNPSIIAHFKSPFVIQNSAQFPRPCSERRTRPSIGASTSRSLSQRPNATGLRPLPCIAPSTMA